MDALLLISAAAIAALFYFFYTKPSQWSLYIQFIPVTAFMVMARFYEMSQDAWRTAFIFAGFCAVAVLIALYRQNVLIERLLFGLNLFFIIGAYGFMFSSETILEWYGASKGGPLFGCIIIVGVFATLLTKAGFVGAKHKNQRAVQYASILLVAASIIALIWSVRIDEQGLLISVVIPFILLRVIRDQLVRQMD